MFLNGAASFSQGQKAKRTSHIFLFLFPPHLLPYPISRWHSKMTKEARHFSHLALEFYGSDLLKNKENPCIFAHFLVDTVGPFKRNIFKRL